MRRCTILGQAERNVQYEVFVDAPGRMVQASLLGYGIGRSTNIRLHRSAAMLTAITRLTELASLCADISLHKNRFCLRHLST
uniref:DUF222 domain-containing protein n=1 Tax=Steinernema glaseri TaxID=37863 RepID=A0A1I8AHK2_9BILA